LCDRASLVEAERTALPNLHSRQRAPIADCIVHLTHSHRDAPESGIRRLAVAAQEADAERALALLLDATQPDVAFALFASAMQSATRVARIDKCATGILAGKGLNDR
jgi:ATP-dependent exoDNAse (exonuclease V) alpha subunit